MNNAVASSRRVGAVIWVLAGIALLGCAFCAPVFEFWGMPLTPYKIFKAADLFTDVSIGPLMNILMIGGAGGAIFFALFVLAAPETANGGLISYLVNLGFTASIVPYFIILIFLITEFEGDILPSFLSFLFYLLSTLLAVVGDSFVGAKDTSAQSTPPIVVQNYPSAPADLPVQSPASTPAVPDSPAPEPIPAAPVVQPSLRALELVRMNTQMHFRIPENTMQVIGRKPGEVDILIPDNPQIGRRHAQISCQQGTFYLTDLNSTNKTYLNSTCLPAYTSYALKQGDYITLANEVFQVRSIS